MEDEELSAYWATKFIYFMTLNTQIDFEDIESPLKTDMKVALELTINPSAPTQGYVVTLKKNKFLDNTDRLQFGDSHSETTIINLH